MKYLALLRGINVGGKDIIKMADLKEAVEKCGFTDVKTYIQSGNVIFESDEKSTGNIAAKLEDSLLKSFNYDTRVIVITREQLKGVVSEAPADWNNRHDLRCYLAFVRESVTAQDVIREIKLKEGIDFVKTGNGVVYMSTLLSGLTKSGFTKLITTKVYKDITIRNYSTVLKLLALMEQSNG